MVPDSLFFLLFRINHSPESRLRIAGGIEKQRIFVLPVAHTIGQTPNLYRFRLICVFEHQIHHVSILFCLLFKLFLCVFAYAYIQFTDSEFQSCGSDSHHSIPEHGHARLQDSMMHLKAVTVYVSFRL